MRGRKTRGFRFATNVEGTRRLSNVVENAVGQFGKKGSEFISAIYLAKP
jgi:hypothetical protein